MRCQFPSPEDGRGTGRGDHCLTHKFIKRSLECWATFTKQCLNAGGEHQAPRKAAHSLQNEVGQNIKDKKRDKRVRDRDPSQGGSHEGEVSKHQETSLAGLWGISEGNITGREKQNKTQNTHLITTPSGKVAQMLTSATSERGLNRKVWVACSG